MSIQFCHFYINYRWLISFYSLHFIIKFSVLDGQELVRVIIILRKAVRKNNGKQMLFSCQNRKPFFLIVSFGDNGTCLTILLSLVCKLQHVYMFIYKLVAGVLIWIVKQFKTESLQYELSNWLHAQTHWTIYLLFVKYKSRQQYFHVTPDECHIFLLFSD